MGDERDLTPEEEAAERELKARIHRQLGVLATVLVLVAVVAGLFSIRRAGFSPWEALGIGASALPWLLLLIGLAVVFSLGTTRLMAGLEWLVRTVRGRKPGQ